MMPRLPIFPAPARQVDAADAFQGVGLDVVVVELRDFVDLARERVGAGVADDAEADVGDLAFVG